MRLPVSSFSLAIWVLVATLTAVRAQAANGTFCGCTAASPLAMFGPSRGRRSVHRSPQLPPSRTSTDSDTIRIDDMLIPRAEFERAASSGTDRLSAPSDYINCVRPWPNGVLRYRFSTTYPSSYKNLIRQSLANLQSSTGNAVTFVEADYFINQPHVTINDGDGCWSYVGKKYSSSSQDLSLKVPNCMLESIIQHEFIHALGFYHEQSRYDRDSYVSIMWNNIDSKHCSNFYKSSYLIPYGFPSYEYDSIMHYTSDTFSCDSSSPTIVKRPSGGLIYYRNSLTSTDVAKLRFVYSYSNLQHCFYGSTTTTSTSTTTTTTRATTTTRRRRSSSSTLRASWMNWMLLLSAISSAAALLAFSG